MSTYPVAYNGTGVDGGDSLTEDLNIYYSVGCCDLLILGFY
jgi:Amt family ammonium transporter